MTLGPLLLLIAIAIIALSLVLWASGTITVGWALSNSGEGAGVGLSSSTNYTGNTVIDHDIDVDGGATNQLNSVYIDTANLKFLVITASKDVTLYANAPSTGAPTDTIVLKAGIAWEWHKDSGIPVSRALVGTAGIITKFYHTNAGVVTVDKTTVKYRGLMDV